MDIHALRRRRNGVLRYGTIRERLRAVCRHIYRCHGRPAHRYFAFGVGKYDQKAIQGRADDTQDLRAVLHYHGTRLFCDRFRRKHPILAVRYQVSVCRLRYDVFGANGLFRLSCVRLPRLLRGTAQYGSHRGLGDNRGCRKAGRRLIARLRHFGVGTQFQRRYPFVFGDTLPKRGRGDAHYHRFFGRGRYYRYLAEQYDFVAVLFPEIQDPGRRNPAGILRKFR